MVYKEFTTFPRKFDHGKVFFHCLKLGNMHAETRIVIEMYDVTSMTEDLRRSLRIGGEKYCVACSPGRMRCNDNHVNYGGRHHLSH